ncbi:MAG: NAD(P)-dependent oxidoreductase [bacterium]|nr:NAD(P)-dependent oxidoreductase [bacterium]
MNIHLLTEPTADALAYLRERLSPTIHLTTGEIVPPETVILVTGRPRREHLAAAPALTALIIPFAGLPQETRALLRDFPQVSVHNLHHNAPMTAEMAVALMLAAAKQLLPADRIFRQNDWTPRYSENTSVVLEGKTVLILGYGAIGRRVGAVCQALGMRVLATKRNPVEALEKEIEIHPPAALPDLLPQAHVVMICLPDTPDTTNLLGAAELALLPPGAILVNVGRAAVVDQTALYEALRSGHLHSAGLDVWYRYPADVDSRTSTPPAEVPFNELDNVVMSPHRAGGGGAAEVEQRRMAALAESLNGAARGEAIPYRVDLARGY